jgi:hypothetical protein
MEVAAAGADQVGRLELGASHRRDREGFMRCG